MREIVLDTETTGFSHENGDRIVEIGALEIVDLMPTGKICHLYINPERSMPEEAFKVHGLGDDFLKDKPLFDEVADEFLDFIGDGRLVIHNAPFDMGFLNGELEASGRPKLTNEVVDTLRLAQDKLPNKNHNLDNLCKIYKIDNSKRTLHGALLDSEILAAVYMELRGGRNYNLSFETKKVEKVKVDLTTTSQDEAAVGSDLIFKPSETELAENVNFREKYNFERGDKDLVIKTSQS